MAGNSAQASNGPYLASKISDLFDNIDSPLNAKDGPLKLIKEKFKAFSDNIDKANKSFEKLGSKVEKLYTPLFDLLKSIKKTTARFDSLNKKLDGIDLSTKFRTKGKNDTKLIEYFEKAFIASSQFHKSVNKAMHVIEDNLLSLGMKMNVIISKMEKSSFDDSNAVKNGDLADKTVMNVNIKSLDRSVYVKIAGIVSKFRKSTNPRWESERSTRTNQGTGLMSTVWKWVKNIFLVVGGIFAIGKLSQFLNTSPVGIFIKEKIKDTFGYLFDKISKYIQGGDIGKTIKSAFQGIAQFIGTIYNEIKAFIVLNAESIKTNLKVIGKSLWEDILAPLGTTIKNDIIIPFMTKVVDNIVQDFKNGDATSGIFKSLATIVGVGLVPALGLAVAGITGPLGLVVALTALAGSVKFMQSAIDELRGNKKGLDTHYNNRISGSEKNIELLKKQKDETFEKWNAPFDPSAGKTMKQFELERKEDEIELQRIDIELQRNQKKLELMKDFVSQGTVAGSVNASYNAQLLTEVEKKFDTQVTPLAKQLSDVYKELDADKAAKLKRAKLKSEYEYNWRDYTKDEPVGPMRKKIDDGIVVEPHSKDQVIAGKLGGPFDLAFKEAVMKLDFVINAINANTAASVQATMEGAKGIMQTVASAAPKAMAPAPHGGNDQIRAARQKSQGFIGS